MTKLLELLADAPREDFEPHATIIEEGKTCSRLFILTAGKVEVIKGETQICQIESVGSTFGEIAALLEIPATATVRADGGAQMAVVEDPINSLRHNIDAALEIARLLARRVNWVTENFATEKNRPNQIKVQAAMRHSLAKRVFDLRG